MCFFFFADKYNVYYLIEVINDYDDMNNCFIIYDDVGRNNGHDDGLLCCL